VGCRVEPPFRRRRCERENRGGGAPRPAGLPLPEGRLHVRHVRPFRPLGGGRPGARGGIGRPARRELRPHRRPLEQHPAQAGRGLLRLQHLRFAGGHLREAGHRASGDARLHRPAGRSGITPQRQGLEGVEPLQAGSRTLAEVCGENRRPVQRQDQCLGNLERTRPLDVLAFRRQGLSRPRPGGQRDDPADRSRGDHLHRRIRRTRPASQPSRPRFSVQGHA